MKPEIVLGFVTIFLSVLGGMASALIAYGRMAERQRAHEDLCLERNSGIQQMLAEIRADVKSLLSSQ